MKPVPLDRIRTDGGTQTRAALDSDTVTRYAEAYKAGEELPPVVVFEDAEGLWLADGFHRHGGAAQAGLKQIPADVRKGGVRDALLYSAGCNSTHGLPRTNADKRRAVTMLLADDEWGEKSDRWIAETCRVSFTLVARVRAELHPTATNCSSPRDSTATSRSSQAAPRTGKDGKKRKPRSPSGTNPKKPKVTPARLEVKDETGRKVPDNLRDVFNDPALAVLVSELTMWRDAARTTGWPDKAKKLAAHNPYLQPSKLIEHMEAAREEIQICIDAMTCGVPFGVCRACGGTGCPDCRQSGFLPEWRAKELKVA
jgi:hypothetical protein